MVKQILTWRTSTSLVDESFKGTVSPAERCDFVGVKLEKVHEHFQVCHICGKGMVLYNKSQYGLLYHESLYN